VGKARSIKKQLDRSNSVFFSRDSSAVQYWCSTDQGGWG